MLHQGSRQGASGVTIYDFDYAISTTRGDKRIISSVAVNDNKLIIANGSLKCKGDACREQSALVKLMEDSIHSLDILSS